MRVFGRIAPCYIQDMNLYLRYFAAFSLLCLILQVNLASAEASAESSIVSNRPEGRSVSADEGIMRAENLLRRTCEFYRNLESFSGEVKTHSVFTRRGVATNKRNRIIFEFDRSRHLRLKSMKADKHGQVDVTGLEACFYIPKWRAYAHQTLVSVDQVFKAQDLGFVTDGALERSLIPALMSSDPYSEIMRNRSVKSYDGLRNVGGKKCHQLTLTTKGDFCESVLWLATGSKPWVVQFMPARDCHLKILPEPVQPEPPTTLSMTEQYVDMRDAVRSKLKPFDPTGARLVKSLAMSSESDARQSLLGEVAPLFHLRTANGGVFKLSKCRNKVVVIEFWATWCPPCCVALPILAQVTSSFPKEDVCFIAINEKENSETVKSFLSERSLSVKVGLDSAGEVAQAYRAVGLPQTVVIGRDGKIKSIHVGINSEFKDTIAKEVRSLL